MIIPLGSLGAMIGSAIAPVYAANGFSTAVLAMSWIASRQERAVSLRSAQQR